jgi:hypothetical protein
MEPADFYSVYAVFESGTAICVADSEHYTEAWQETEQLAAAYGVRAFCLAQTRKTA